MYDDMYGYGMSGEMYGEMYVEIPRRGKFSRALELELELAVRSDEPHLLS